MPSLSELLSNTVVRIALVIVVLIALGSLSYYLIETQPPKLVYATATTSTISQTVTGSGTVTPVQNPTLSFEQGGQVTSVNVTVGEKVSAGTVLATQDTSVLDANLEAAQAKLSELEAGPRSVDVAGQQTAVTEAQQTLANTYTNYPITLQTTFNQAEQAVYTGADPYFTTASDPSNPSLVLQTVNPALGISVGEQRGELTGEFTEWQQEIGEATSSPSQATLQTVTTESLTHLASVQSFLNNTIVALNDVQVSEGTQSAQQAVALASVTAARDTVNGLISSLTAASQSLSTQQLAVQSAQDTLNQTLAGAASQDIEAQQAAVAAIEAQIAQLEIIAPFSGTIGSVSIKNGDVVQPNTPAITVIPNGTFEVDVYVAENDATQVKVGQAVDVTLDAYGTGKIFPATVGSIDTSPSTDPTNPDSTGYKVTIVFAQADPSITNGMHANVTIHVGNAQNAVTVPTSAIITNGTGTYVLQQTAAGLVQTPVTIGIQNASTTQIISGISAGAVVSAVGSEQ